MTLREREVRGENLANPDDPRFLWVDPEELIKDNPAALIINKLTYQGMKAHFSEERFTRFPPEAAWVEIYTPEGIKEKLLVIDGLTRSKFAADNKGKVLKEAPNFSFDTIQVFNITEDILQDPRIVLPEERTPGQRALTMQQFLRAVVPPTIVHSEIAADRIAGHLTNAWVGKVGPDLADRFPAVAAFAFLANSQMGMATDNELQKTLAKQEKLVVNEQSEERKRLNQALREIAAIIRQSGLRATEIEQATYVLIGSGSVVIGGTKEAKRQIHGLLRSVVFENKLIKEYRTQIGLAENVRLEFARALEAVFKRFSDGSPASETALNKIKEVLADNSLTTKQTLQIVTAESPEREHDRMIRTMNKQALRQQYQQTVNRQSLTEREQTLIDNLGNKTSLLEPRIPGIVRDIQFTVAILRQSEDWQRQLETEANNLIEHGVNPTTINTARLQMSQRQQSVLRADTETLADRTRALQRVVEEFQQTVAEERLKYNVGEEIEKVFKQELTTTQESQFKDRLVWAVLHARDLDKSNPADINRWLKNLKKLDADLQTEIMAGTIEIAAAFRIQRRRQVVETTPRAEEVRPSALAVDEVAPQAPRRVEPQLQNQISQEEIRRGRTERNSHRLRIHVIERHLIPAISELAIIDLNPQEVPDYLRKLLGDAEIAIEKIRGGHPDVVRIMDTDYPHLLQEVTRLREVIVNLERR